ncbi:helix-turn-helix domain-containing protein [Dysgonomonas alginatilytica]|nr:hypothetical protein [Dysgonomonas alginatilytica]
MDINTMIDCMRKQRKRYRFTANEQALFYELMAVFRHEGFPDTFFCSSKELCNDLGLIKNTFVNARNKLISAGLVFYKSGKSRSSVSQYSFTRSFQSNTVNGTVVSTEVGTVSTTATATFGSSDNTKKNHSKPFIPPRFEEVETYCLERKNGIDPQTFIDHYTANGWMRGKTKVKDWKACVRTWEQNRNKNENNRTDNNKPKDYGKGF